MKLSFSGYCVAIYVLQMVVLTSEHFTVTNSRSYQVGMVGEHVEFSCQLSPPQSAEHMNIGWYRDHYSQPVHMHEKGKEVSGKYTQNYMNRTVLLKDGLREGKMTLRIHNISVFDEGEYHCFFKDDDTNAEASTHLKVAALGLDIQINFQFYDTELMVECSSRGWFPQAQMEWRDGRGDVIPPSSNIFSQDGAGLLHLKTTVLLKNNTHGPVTCCFHNLVTDQKKKASIVLPDILFKSECWAPMAYTNVCLLMGFTVLLSLPHLRGKAISFYEVLQNKWVIPCSECLYLLMTVIFFSIYRSLWNRVSLLGDLSLMYSMWMDDFRVILIVLMLFFTTLIFSLLCTLKGFLQSWIPDCSFELQDT